MPRLRDVLYRFRPAGTPGRASAAAVPVDRMAGLVAELEPVFARLTPVESSCDDMVQAARGAAATTRAAAAAEADRVIARAREQVGVERARAGQQARERLEAESAEVMAAAGDEVEQSQLRTSALLPGYVDRVVASLSPLLGPLVGSGTGSGTDSAADEISA
jgi:vacuolar-type H+-ATPase subunit H